MQKLFGTFLLLALLVQQVDAARNRRYKTSARRVKQNKPSQDTGKGAQAERGSSVKAVPKNSASNQHDEPLYHPESKENFQNYEPPHVHGKVDGKGHDRMQKEHDDHNWWGVKPPQRPQADKIEPQKQQYNDQDKPTNIDHAEPLQTGLVKPPQAGQENLPHAGPPLFNQPKPPETDPDQIGPAIFNQPKSPGTDPDQVGSPLFNQPKPPGTNSDQIGPAIVNHPKPPGTDPDQIGSPLDDQIKPPGYEPFHEGPPSAIVSGDETFASPPPPPPPPPPSPPIIGHVSPIYEDGIKEDTVFSLAALRELMEVVRLADDLGADRTWLCSVVTEQEVAEHLKDMLLVDTPNVHGWEEDEEEEKEKDDEKEEDEEEEIEEKEKEEEEEAMVDEEEDHFDDWWEEMLEKKKQEEGGYYNDWWEESWERKKQEGQLVSDAKKQWHEQLINNWFEKESNDDLIGYYENIGGENGEGENGDTEEGNGEENEEEESDNGSALPASRRRRSIYSMSPIRNGIYRRRESHFNAKNIVSRRLFVSFIMEVCKID